MGNDNSDKALLPLSEGNARLLGKKEMRGKEYIAQLPSQEGPQH